MSVGVRDPVWTSEVNFKSECLAGSQDIKRCVFSLEKHYLLSQFQLHLIGTVLINKLITQITKTLCSQPAAFWDRDVSASQEPSLVPQP